MCDVRLHSQIVEGHINVHKLRVKGGVTGVLQVIS